MSVLIEDQESALWKKLHATWLSERKPGTVILGGRNYKVFKPSEDEVKFLPLGGFDNYYGSGSEGMPS